METWGSTGIDIGKREKETRKDKDKVDEKQTKLEMIKDRNENKKGKGKIDEEGFERAENRKEKEVRFSLEVDFMEIKKEIKDFKEMVRKEHEDLKKGNIKDRK